jgi:hypothetical protein
MKLFQISIFLLVAGSAAIALGQYGLYGSPDPIQMSQQMPNTVPSGGYAAPSSVYAAPANGVAQKTMQPNAVQQPQPYTIQPAQQAVIQPAQQAVIQPAQQAVIQPAQQAVIQPAQQAANQPAHLYANQSGQQYASQPVQQIAGQTAQPYAAQQMQAARPAATYGQIGSQYQTPTYTPPTYYTAAVDQTGMAQPVTSQPIMAVPQAMPVPQSTPAAQVPAPQRVYEPVPATGTQQNSGVMNQMLIEQGQAGSVPAGACEGYMPPVNRCEQAACGGVDSGCSESLWYGSLTMLAMTRDRPNMVYITYETGNLPHNVYPPDEFGWSWGGEARFGRRFCCGCNAGYWALEASYWTLGNFDSSVSHTSPASSYNPYGLVGTPLRVGDIEFGGTSGTSWFDNASEHRLWRRDEVHNVEINFVRGQWCYGQNSPWDLGWSMGLRYFRFQESWRFGSLAGPFTQASGPIPGPYHYWGEAGGLYEAYINDRITNNFIGPQLGFELGYNMGCNLRFYLAPKVGIYVDHIDNNFQAYLGNGVIATTGSSGVQGTYPVDSSTDPVSFLTQVDVGLDWKFARQWSAQIGYRILAASRIGLADAQIPFYVVDIPAIADIDKNGDLFMHGGYATIGFNF